MTFEILGRTKAENQTEHVLANFLEEKRKHKISVHLLLLKKCSNTAEFRIALSTMPSSAVCRAFAALGKEYNRQT